MVDKEILKEHDKIVGDLGKIVLGIIMMVVSGLHLLKIFESSSSIMAILLFFGGIGTMMWGIRK